MGIFRVRVKVYNLSDETRAREIEMVVDSGATYPLIPRELADELGISPETERTFTLADGNQIVRFMARAGLAYDGRSAASMVVIGERGDVPILGAHALEGLGFGVDPVAKTLRPAPQYLLGSGSHAPAAAVA